MAGSLLSHGIPLSSPQLFNKFHSCFTNLLLLFHSTLFSPNNSHSLSPPCLQLYTFFIIWTCLMTTHQVLAVLNEGLEKNFSKKPL